MLATQNITQAGIKLIALYFTLNILFNTFSTLVFFEDLPNYGLINISITTLVALLVCVIMWIKASKIAAAISPSDPDTASSPNATDFQSIIFTGVGVALLAVSLPELIGNTIGAISKHRALDNPDNLISLMDVFSNNFSYSIPTLIRDILRCIIGFSLMFKAKALSYWFSHMRSAGLTK